MPIPTRISSLKHRLRKFNRGLSEIGLHVDGEALRNDWMNVDADLHLASQKVLEEVTALSGYYWRTDVSNTPFQYIAHELCPKPKTWIGPFKTKAECQAYIDGQTHLEEDFS